MHTDDWLKCYGDGWGKRLRPASYSHPAKASYALTVRIYEHALAKGWIELGGIVLDPFAGIGGFALEAMRHGLHFVGCELEMRFCDMGQGCDCTGISKEDWVRFQNRWDRARYKDGRHWCPECVMKASAVTNERKFKVAEKRKIKPLPLPGTKWGALAKTRQATIFDVVPSASYVRNSGKIPCTPAHHYRGNIETWEAQGMPGTAVIVQGDSRRLGEVLERASLCLSSPPYTGDALGHAGRASEIDMEKRLHARIAGGIYGETPGNLGNLPDTGFEAALALSSPVYISNTASDDPDKRGGLYRDPKRRNDKTLTATYSEDEAQLAQMPEGDFALTISSPPFIGSLGDGKSGIDWSKQADRETAHSHGWDGEGYGTEPGQLAALPEGDHAEACERPAIAISSPPWESSIGNAANTPETKMVRPKLPNANEVAAYLKQKRIEKGLSLREVDDYLGTVTLYSWYEGRPAGTQIPTPENWRKLKALLGLDDRFDSGILTVEKMRATSLDTVNKTGHFQMTDYGITNGQLAQMPPGDHAAALEAGAETGRAGLCLSSPPWMGTLPSTEGDDLEHGDAGKLYVSTKGLRTRGGDRNSEAAREQRRVLNSQINLGAINTSGNKGRMLADDFWAASRQILEEVYKVLAPGGHAIWVVKMFVRNKKLVDFPGQWEALCQSVGFKTVCKHRAWLNKNAGIVQATLDGDEVSMEKWFKSFFRRLCESKGSPRIDWELILCMEKP